MALTFSNSGGIHSRGPSAFGLSRRLFFFAGVLILRILRARDVFAFVD